MDSLLSFCLSVQVVLAIVVPAIPIPSLGRSLFPSDLWVFVALAALAVESRWLGWRPDRSFLRRLTALTLVFFVAYFHGKYRVRLPADYSRFGRFESDSFNPVHEFVMMFRYWSWMIEGVWFWNLLTKMDSARRGALKRSMCKALEGILFASSALTILTAVSPSFKDFLGPIYGYDPSVQIWWGSGFGPFRSPLEAGLTLSLGGLLLFSLERKLNRLQAMGRKGLLVLTAAGAILSRAMVAITAVLGAWMVGRMRKAAPSKKALFVGGLVVATAALYFFDHDFFMLKVSDFVVRWGPWKVLTGISVSRWDMFLFGFGFNPVNVDNAYLFLFFKLGLLGAVVLGYGAVLWIKNNWSRWSVGERDVITFLLISGFTLDTFMIRPVVTVFVAIGLPLLAGPWVPNQEDQEDQAQV